VHLRGGQAQVEQLADHSGALGHGQPGAVGVLRVLADDPPAPVPVPDP
jgi:hypothetical protein